MTPWVRNTARARGSRASVQPASVQPDLLYPWEITRCDWSRVVVRTRIHMCPHAVPQWKPRQRADKVGLGNKWGTNAHRFLACWMFWPSSGFCITHQSHTTHITHHGMLCDAAHCLIWFFWSRPSRQKKSGSTYRIKDSCETSHEKIGAHDVEHGTRGVGNAPITRSGRRNKGSSAQSGHTPKTAARHTETPPGGYFTSFCRLAPICAPLPKPPPGRRLLYATCCAPSRPLAPPRAPSE